MCCHTIIKVKHHRTRLVVGWVTTYLMKAVFDAKNFASMTFNNYLRTKGVPNVSFLKDATASDDTIKPKAPFPSLT